MRFNEFEMLPEGAFQPRAGGGMRLYGKGDNSAPSADPNIGLAQKQMADLSSKQWDKFTTDIYPEMLKQSQSQEARAQSQYDLTSSITQKQQGYADEDRARYEAGAIPAMEKLKSDADLYNTPAEQERLAGLAMGDIKTSADAARQQTEMRQRSYGIDPTSGVAAGNANSNQIMLAGAQAAAANQTRQAAKDLGLQKQANVYNMYAGLPAQSNASTGIALGSSAQGLAGGQTGINNLNTTGTALNQATTTANAGWQGVGSLGVGKYGADVSAYNAQQQAGGAMASGLGSALGSAAALYKMA